MPKVTLFNQTGSQVGDIELNESIFGIEPNNHVLFEAIIMQRALYVKELIKLKTVLKLQAVDVNLGNKKELDVRVKVLSVLHNGVAVALFLDQLQDLTLTSYLKRYVV